MDIQRKPDWLRISRRVDGDYAAVQRRVSGRCLNTICQSGRCPNQAECWSRGTATFMLLGDRCTRSCKFCATLTARPLPPDADEPQKLKQTVEELGLRYVVLTSVTRDDLPDGGAKHWRKCIEAVQTLEGVRVEALVPDFNQQKESILEVLQAHPAVFAHNIETVERLTPLVRSRATYRGSLETLRIAAEAGAVTKTSIMVGLGETEQEVIDTMKDALRVGVQVFTLGQYLQPSRKHYPVAAYVEPKQFERYRELGLTLGLRQVVSGPLVRSSYRAEEVDWHRN